MLYLKSFFFVKTVVIIVVLFLFSCSKKTNPITQPPKDNIIYFNVYKGRCPNCPVYSVKIAPNQDVVYVGKENVKPMDTVRFTISEKHYSAIITELNKTDFNTYEDTYFSKIRDIPVSEITYNGKTVQFQKKECPVSLHHFVTLVEELVTE